LEILHMARVFGRKSFRLIWLDGYWHRPSLSVGSASEPLG
jgi:hypothetical protein